MKKVNKKGNEVNWKLVCGIAVGLAIASIAGYMISNNMNKKKNGKK